MDEQICDVASCERVVYSQGLCNMHRLRLRRTGTTDPTPRVRRVDVDPCEIDGCEQPIKARGWCGRHYHRWERHGSPTGRVRGEVVDGKRICPRCGEDKPLDEWGARLKYCLECGNSRRREWVATHPQDQSKANLDRRARLLAVRLERFAPREIFDRDAWTCQLCCEPLDREAPPRSRWSPSVDHIVPLSRGGVHTRENVRAAHFGCNARKNRRLDSEMEGGAA